MSTTVAEHIVEEVRDAPYFIPFAIKVDGTRDPPGWENLSIVLWFIDANNSIKAAFDNSYGR